MKHRREGSSEEHQLRAWCGVTNTCQHTLYYQLQLTESYRQAVNPATSLLPGIVV